MAQSTNPLTAAIMAALASDVPLLLWGDSGTGKTALFMAMARDAGAHLETLIGSQVDPVDVGGYLVPDAQGRVTSSPPPWAVRLRQALDEGKPSWLFMDELSCAPPSVQAALLRVVNERWVGGLSIQGCTIIAAANPEEVAADGGSLSPAMALRWMHLDFKPDYQEWAQGELGGWGSRRSREHAEASALICSFIRKNPKALMPAEAGGKEYKGRGGPRPRTWSMAAKALSKLEASTARDAVLSSAGLKMLTGLVGDGVAGEMVSFATQLDLKDPEDYLRGAKLPQRADQQSAAMDAVVAAVISTPSHTRVQEAWRVIGGGRPDVAIIPAKTLLEAFPGEPIPSECLELGNKLVKVGALG